MTDSRNHGGFKPLQILDEQLREVFQRVETKSRQLDKDMGGHQWYRKAKRWQKDLEKRTKGLQKDLEKRTKSLQKDLQKRTKGVQKDINKRRDDAYHLAGLATKAEVDALNRRLRQINKAVSL